MTERQTRILAYLAEHPLATTSEIAKATGTNIQATRQALNIMYAHGLVGRQLPMTGIERSTGVRWQLEENAA